MSRIVFLHPDLGIGGAERAVIDAALALKSRGHHVQIVTSHHDPNHCFEETRDGRLSVTAVGDWLPRSLFGRFYALFAYLRMIYAAIYLVFFSRISYDLVFCDQISACIPVLKLCRSSKILFYCHFPDLLLTQRKNLLKKIYRVPIDWLEEKTTGMADVVLVNSLFTANIFKETFTSLQKISPEVLYPIPDFSSFVDLPEASSDIPTMLSSTRITFLSINRYERKKNLPLAIQALATLRDDNHGNLDGIHLIVAGGYDERVDENRQHYLELTRLVESLSLKENVSFYRSISAGQKQSLLKGCTCLIYTPDREHFGIVPVEAMYMGCPVIAVNSGGPKETVLDGVTGYLCAPEPRSFADAMFKFVTDRDLKGTLGAAAHDRVVKHFSFEAFTEKLNNIVHLMLVNEINNTHND